MSIVEKLRRILACFLRSVLYSICVRSWTRVSRSIAETKSEYFWRHRVPGRYCFQRVCHWGNAWRKCPFLCWKCCPDPTGMTRRCICPRWSDWSAWVQGYVDQDETIVGRQIAHRRRLVFACECDHIELVEDLEVGRYLFAIFEVRPHVKFRGIVEVTRRQGELNKL